LPSWRHVRSCGYQRAGVHCQAAAAAALSVLTGARRLRRGLLGVLACVCH
jgi:hypothetical protein